jgi:TolA-binding protein
MSLVMSRSFSRFGTLVACTLFVCTFAAGAARAQVSDADLVTRIGRLEATIRELTGRVEQLQYRNQQLEQQVQRLQEEAPRAEEGRGPPRSPLPAPARPTAQYPPPQPP